MLFGRQQAAVDRPGLARIATDLPVEADVGDRQPRLSLRDQPVRRLDQRPDLGHEQPARVLVQLGSVGRRRVLRFIVPGLEPVDVRPLRRA